ncbi:MAG: DUF5309 family protein [Candidatus Aenigmatarchaeota archaeon]
MANIIGTKTTGLIEQHRLVIDMEDTIHLLDPNANPFLVLTSLVGKGKGRDTIFNPEFKWMEDDYVGTYTTLAQDANANATDLIVTDSSIFKPNDIITSTNTSNCDYMLITSINRTNNTLTVVRRIAGETTAPAIQQGALIVRITDAFKEGAAKGDIISTQTTQLENYTQIIRTAFGVTGTLDATKLYGGADLGYQRKKAGIEHAIKIERAMLFGRKGKLDGTTEPRRFMKGLYYFIQTNVTDLAGNSLTEIAFEEFLESGFMYGNETKYLLCAPKIISQINLWARGKLRLVPGEKTYGLAVMEYLSAHGHLYLVNCKKVFNIAPWDSMAILVDIDKVKPVVLRPTKLRTNIQNPDEDKEIDEYIGEYSIKVYNEKCHALLTNVGPVA